MRHYDGSITELADNQVFVLVQQDMHHLTFSGIIGVILVIHPNQMAGRVSGT